jgi:hypothetical protein
VARGAFPCPWPTPQSPASSKRAAPKPSSSAQGAGPRAPTSARCARSRRGGQRSPVHRPAAVQRPRHRPYGERRYRSGAATRARPARSHRLIADYTRTARAKLQVTGPGPSLGSTPCRSSPTPQGPRYRSAPQDVEWSRRCSTAAVRRARARRRSTRRNSGCARLRPHPSSPPDRVGRRHTRPCTRRRQTLDMGRLVHQAFTPPAFDLSFACCLMSISGGAGPGAVPPQGIRLGTRSRSSWD